MSIGLDSAFDLFRKGERDREAVERAVTPDTVFNFVVTAHALRDWVQKDPALSPTAKRIAAELAVSNDWLLACKDLANGNKHFSIDRYEPVVDHADAAVGFGLGRSGAGSYGAGEWSIRVSWGGSTYDTRELVARVHETWASFFREHLQQSDGYGRAEPDGTDERGRDSP